MAQDGVPRGIRDVEARVRFERGGGRCGGPDESGEVLVGVEIFEEAADGVEVFAGEVEYPPRAMVGEVGAGFDEVGALGQQVLVGGEGGGVVALADFELDNGGS